MQVEPISPVRVLETRVAVTTLSQAVDRIISWSAEARSRYVCAVNVHMVMEAHDDPEFVATVNAADLAVADGMPIVWAQRLLGSPGAGRVRGPDLMEAVIQAAAANNVPIGLYGGTDKAVVGCLERFKTRLPTLNVAYATAPPFRSLTPQEDTVVCEDIVSSGARILFVGLGCPKQERWMAAHTDRVFSVMIGVGAAFDIFGGQKRSAHLWMQASGLEWLFRLGTETRRLWKRYLKHNPRFVLLFLGQWIRYRLGRIVPMPNNRC